MGLPDAIFICLIFGLTFVIIRKFFDSNKNLTATLKVLYVSSVLTHFVIGFGMFCLFGEVALQDAIEYYKNPFSWHDYVHSDIIGSAFIHFLHYPLKSIGLHFPTLFLAGSFISYLGLHKYFQIVFYCVLNRALSTWEVLSIVFLTLVPSIHFWTGAMGKDAIAYTGLSFLAADIFFHKRLKGTAVIGLLMLVMVRPYAALCVAVSLFVISLFFESGNNKKQKWFRWIVFATISVFLLVLLKNYAGLEDFSLASLDKWKETLQLSYFDNSKSSIDIQNTSIFQRVIYLFTKPTLWDANNYRQVFAAIENIAIVLFLAFCTLTFLRNRKTVLKSKVTKTKIFTYLIIATLLLTFTVAFFVFNVGYAIKLRVMILPYLMLLIFFVALAAHKASPDVKTCGRLD